MDDVDNINEWMKSNGWVEDELANSWSIDVTDALSVPTAPFGLAESRVVTDFKTGHVVDIRFCCYFLLVLILRWPRGGPEFMSFQVPELLCS